jgi:ABC-type xylose transport system permease subunit
VSAANKAYDELVTEALPARQRYLSQITKSFTLLILFVIMIVFSLYGGTSFFNARNLNDIIIDSSQLVVLSVGMTFVIIAAGIDLSVGSVLILSSVVAAKVTIALSGTPQDIANFQFPTQHIGIPVGLLARVATGLLCGIFNGVLITRLRVPAFIVTLGMLGIALGLGQEYSNNDANVAAQITAARLQSDPDLAGIFGTNLFSAQGAAAALREQGLQGQVKMVGFDAGPTQVQDLRSEVVDLLIAQHPGDIGEIAVQLLHDFLTTGEPLDPKDYVTGATIVTRDNIDDPEVARYLYVADCANYTLANAVPMPAASPEATPTT